MAVGWGSLGDQRKVAWLGIELWLRRKGLALASPHSSVAIGPTFLYSPGPTFLFYEMGREVVSLAMHSCGSNQSSIQERCRAGHRVSVAQSQSAATSVPGLFPLSEWAQSSGHVIKKGGACSGSENGPGLGWLGRGGHTSCNKTILHVATQARGLLPITEVPAT